MTNIEYIDGIGCLGSLDKRIVQWYVEDMSVVNVIEAGLTSGVTCLQLSRDNTFLIAATEDSQLLVYAFTTGTLVHSLSGHDAKVPFLSWAGGSKSF